MKVIFTHRQKTLDERLDAILYEGQQRLRWYIHGIGIHCLPPELFARITTERLCELYNVEMSFFKK